MLGDRHLHLWDAAPCRSKGGGVYLRLSGCCHLIAAPTYDTAEASPPASGGPARASGEESQLLSAGDAWDWAALKHLIRPVFTGRAAPAASRRGQVPSSGNREEAEAAAGSDTTRHAVGSHFGCRRSRMPGTLLSYVQIRAFYLTCIADRVHE